MYGGSSSPSAYYFDLSGTSMATGVVSGAVADLLQAQPRLTPDQVKARLMKTAYKTFPQSSSVYDPTTGNTYTANMTFSQSAPGIWTLQRLWQAPTWRAGPRCLL